MDPSEYRLVTTQFEPNGMLVVGYDLTPCPLLVAAYMALRARRRQRELRT